MKELIYGTTNLAKLKQVHEVLSPHGFRITGIGKQAPTIPEDGKSAEENARRKALFYSHSLGSPVLSNDVALYFYGLPDSLQPGLYVRRIHGQREASDEEILAYYASLVASLGEAANAYWHGAYVLAWPDGRSESFTYNTPRTFVSKPSATLSPGFPLDSLQLNPETGLYFSEMPSHDIAKWWHETIGVPLADFVTAHLGANPS